MPPVSRHVTLATGLRYHYLEWEAPPEIDHTVVLVHGFLDLSWSWQPVVDAGLAGRFHVIAPDMRGHGDSDWIGAGGYYHFADYFADLDDLLPRVARKRLSLVGHSMGGSIVSYYTGTFAERVHKLALLEGIGPPESGALGPERVSAWLAAWRRIRETPVKPIATVADAAARLRKHDPLCSPEEALRLAEHGTRPTEGGVRFKHDPLHATMGPYGFQVQAAMSFWSRVNSPVLYLDGSESAFRHAGEETDRRLATFRDLRRVTIPGAAHMMMRHKPAEVAAELGRFLADPA